MTFTGAGNVAISGLIDGGGVINTLGGAKPGGLIKNNTGSLTLTGSSVSFMGDVTVNTGTLALNPPGGVTLWRRVFRLGRAVDQCDGHH